MPNRQVFKTAKTGKNIPKATGETSEGFNAFTLHPEQALAELACVGTFNNTYYNDGQVQMDTILSLAEEVDDEYLAQLAIYSREKAFMKDMPAVLLALLSTRSPELFNKVFHRVIDNPRMIRGFVQIMRSGAVGRKSLGSAPKKRVQEAIQRLPDFMLLNGSVGNDPSLADVIKMVHPKPVNSERMSAEQMEAAFAWIIGKPCDLQKLPAAFQNYEAFKAGEMDQVPRVNFRLIDGLPNMDERHWRDLGFSMNWTTLRMNLMTLQRHGVLDKSLVEHAAKVLSDRENVRKSKCFPYQLMTALNMTLGNVPRQLTDALQDALEISVENVPAFPGRVLVTVDISGSMTAPVTGDRRSSTRCIDVACLFGSVVFRRNPEAKITAFSEALFHPQLNSRDSLVTIAEKIKGTGLHGATNWSVAIDWALREREKFDAIVWFSDMEANLDGYRKQNDEYCWGTNLQSTRAAKLVDKYRATINKNVKIITVNLAANKGHAQVEGKFDPNVLQIGGFSDRVFDVVGSFIEAKEPGHWVKVIKATEI